MSTKRLCAMCWGKIRDAGTQTRQASSDWAKTICDGCGERRYTTAFEVTAAKKAARREAGK